MADLRDALERRSRAFDVEPGFLERTLERRDALRRRRRIVAGSVALLIALAGISVAYLVFRGGAGTPAVRPIVTPRPTIQEGVYWTRSLTRHEVMRTILDRGYSRAEARRYYFDMIPIFTDEIRMGLVVQDGFWIQAARANGGEQEAGWSGTFQIVGSDRVVAEGYGCTITYRFDVADGTLMLDVLEETGEAPECGQGDLVAQTAIFESAPFVRDA
jgi:hypothetical protein